MKLAQLLDDRTAHADKARIAVWAEQVEPFELALDDLLNGVRAYYADPRERLSESGIIAAARRSVVIATSANRRTDASAPRGIGCPCR